MIGLMNELAINAREERKENGFKPVYLLQFTFCFKTCDQPFPASLTSVSEVHLRFQLE